MPARMTSEVEPKRAAEDDVGRILNELSARVDAEPAQWREHIFHAISGWGIPREEIADEPHVYIIGGEAFNWRRLAERLAWHITFLLNEEEEVAMSRWLEDDHMFGGLKESQFRRVLGHEKWRAFLNYFYGVTLERCLVVHSGLRIVKDRNARGRPVNEDAMDEAYYSLHGAAEMDLWLEFASELGLDAELANARTLAIDDEFTYWLFKRRIGTSYSAHVAHEVKLGLEALASITAADERRKHMLDLRDCSELLEFKLSRHVSKSGMNARKVSVNHA